MFRLNRSHCLALCSGLGLALFLACSKGGSSASASTQKGTLSVTLVDGPAPNYQEINVNIQKVEIHTSGTPGDSGWMTVSEPKKIVDLLKLRNGLVETLAAGKTLETGRYQQMRLVLGETGNTLKLAGGSSVTLEIPSAQRTGIKIPLSFEVAPGTTADIWIDFDGAHSIQVHAGGGPAARYVLRPVIHAIEKVATGSVSGTLTGPAGPLSGAVVMAQTVDGSGNVGILRTAQTNASGGYTLGLLPLGLPFFIVTQPVVGTTAFEAKASAALTLASATATLTQDFSFAAPALSVGGANGSISPAAGASQSDIVLLLKPVTTGVNLTVLAVATANGVVGTPSESYAFTFVPAGNYTVQGLRTTLATDGTTTTVRSTFSPTFSVNNGASTVQNLAF